MTKISITVKNANPEIYGFEHPWDIPGNTKEEIKVNYVLFEDADGDKRCCPCIEEYYKFEENWKREERRRIDNMTRCWIHSDKYGLVKCRCKCDGQCPHRVYINKEIGKKYYGECIRVGGPLSLDELSEDDNFEYVDEDADTVLDEMIKEERTNQINKEIASLKEDDRKIVVWFSEGLSDSEIAIKMNSKKSTIQYKRNRIFNELREKLKKINLFGR